MAKQVAVIGLGRFGTNLAIMLHNSGYDVLAIDKAAELVESISAEVTHAVRINASNEAALQKLGIKNFDVAVVAIGASIQDSVMTTILLKKMGVKYIVARADNELHGEILSSIGADKVIFPEKDTALRAGPVLTMKDVTDYIPLGIGSGMVKAKAPANFVGRTLSDIGFGSGGKNDVVVLMIQRGKEALVNPAVDEVVSYVDILIIAGNVGDIDKIIEKAENFEPPTARKRNGINS
jgi:trk system potassium uptake protein TrkA